MTSCLNFPFISIWSSPPQTKHLSIASDYCIFTFPQLAGVPVRLQGPLSGNGTGRVEIFYNGQWGTICDLGWDMNEARVACRELGYKYAVRALKESEVPVGTGKIWLDNLACSGSEKNVSRCPHSDWGLGNCNHSKDAGVECSTTGNGTFLYFLNSRYMYCRCIRS